MFDIVLKEPSSNISIHIIDIKTLSLSLKKYLDKHFVDVKLAMEMIYKHSKAIYLPLIFMQSSLGFLVIISFMKYQGVVKNPQFLPTFTNLVYLKVLEVSNVFLFYFVSVRGNVWF